ncbi:hypothetical protein [Bernardetia sp.]|uniref:hypothetical protein n=1 Tax=Bernardetia sp. TaxID=1937974 RepID=UPI0025BD2729|nr:hypothetical protein [Bernardetia sp.]
MNDYEIDYSKYPNLEHEEEEKCELCEREKRLSFHHLIPRKMHRKKPFLRKFGKEEMKTRGIMVCRKCHSTIHKFWDEKTLGEKYNTKEKLMATEEMQKFVAWVKKVK